MAVVRPFRGWRYNLARAGDVNDLLSPPYDIVSPEQARDFRAKSPCNAMHVELPAGSGSGSPDEEYAAAGALFSTWQQDAVVVREDRPSLYLYAQEFELPDGLQHRRLGVLSSLKLEDYQTGVVLPHEQTFPKHKEDRFRLLTAARMQFSPIMGLFPAPEVDVRSMLESRTTQPPELSALDGDGVHHSLWVVQDTGFLEAWRHLLSDRQVFIADGHHRYETALRYQASRASTAAEPLQWFDGMLAYLIAMEDPGLALMPTHRLVRGVRAELPPNAGQRFVADFEVTHVTQPRGPVQPGHIRLVTPGGVGWCDLHPRSLGSVKGSFPDASDALASLEAAVLHRHILPRLLGSDTNCEVVYTRDAEEVRRRVSSGEFQLGFILPAPRVDQMRAISLNGERMPEKTTYFWPKAQAGLVFYGEGSL